MASATSVPKVADGLFTASMAPGVSGGMLSYEDLQAQLDAERSWWSTSIQTIQMQQVQALEDMINEKVGKSVEMTCALSASCDERFGQIEAQAAERSAEFDRLRLELVARVEVPGGPGRSASEQAMDKREVISELNALQSDIEAMWIQHRAVLSGISFTKEQQQHLEVSFGELRKDLEGALTDVRAQHSSFSGLAADWEQLRSQVRSIEASVRGELSKAQVAGSASPQKFDALRKEYREEFVHEVTMLRQELEVLSGYGDCLQRLQEKAESVQDLQQRQEEVHERLESLRDEQRHEILAVRQEMEARGPDSQLANEVFALRQEIGVRQQVATVAPAVAHPNRNVGDAMAEKVQQLEADVKVARADLEAEVMQRCVNVSDLHARLAREIADMGRRVETHWGEISHVLERRARV